ncbi:MAG: glutathione synthase [Acidimicrobiia bacterium]|nr:glutathione synthase [Acidimicrobiia bacterium]
MDIVVVMDGPETVDPDTDTSFALITAAQERDHRVWHCLPSDLSIVEGRVGARATPAIADETSTPPLLPMPGEDVDLAAVDAVLIRTDPPFDDTYLRLTLMLDPLTRTATSGEQTLVVNSPRGLRDANEKLYSLRFPEITPETIVTADADRITAFAMRHGGAVVKPIEGHGGRGVMAVRPDDHNAPSIIDTMTTRGRVPVVAQRFLDGVAAGDKRILLLDGEPLGAILRRPTDTDFRANICVGGTVEVVELDDDDHRIIETIAPSLHADGLHFVGIDVIDGLLSEVNVTSPTGLSQLTALGADRPDLAVIRWLERTVAR